MTNRNELDCCFILNMDLDMPVSDVHLVLDVINTFNKNKVIIKKGKNENLQIDHNGYININTKIVKKRNLIGRYITDYVYYKKVASVIKENRITSKSFFIQSSPLAFFIVKYLKKHTNARIVYNAQDLFPDNIIGGSKVKHLLFAPFNYLTKKLFKKVDHIITISTNIKDQIVSKGISNSKITVIYNWAKKEVPQLENFNYKEKFSLSGKFVVLYAGNIGKFQNVKMILDTAKLIQEPEIVFVIQGDGVKRKELEAYAKRLSLTNVVFVPQAPLDTMMKTYRSVDLNLITLNKNIYKTALPSKLAFCLNTKVPLIITIESQSDLCQILNEDSLTTIINPDDIEALKTKILAFFSNKKINNYNKRESIVNQYFNRSLNSQIYHDVIVGNQHIGG